MVVREAQTTDSDSIAELLTELGYPVDANTAYERIIGIKKFPNTHILLADVDHKIEGLVAVSWQPMLHYSAPVARITELVVQAAQKRKGIGQKLVKAAEECAKKSGCTFIEVTTAYRRDDAQSFYKAQGYEQTSMRLQKSLQ